MQTHDNHNRPYANKHKCTPHTTVTHTTTLFNFKYEIDHVTNRSCQLSLSLSLSLLAFSLSPNLHPLYPLLLPFLSSSCVSVCMSLYGENLWKLLVKYFKLCCQYSHNMFRGFRRDISPSYPHFNLGGGGHFKGTPITFSLTVEAFVHLFIEKWRGSVCTFGLFFLSTC